MPSTLTITHLSHDLQHKKSYVSFVWADDPSKRLGLEVPYGTALEQVEAEAHKAVLALRDDLAASQLHMPE